jgi:hypothetical protein
MKTSTMKAFLVGGSLVAIASLSSCYYKSTEVQQPEPSVASVTTYNPGYVVQTLPSGYQTRTVRGTTYYTYHGTYYRPSTRGYVVVESP